MDINQSLKNAVNFHNAGQLERAKEICLRIRENAPRHPDPLHLLGVIAYQTGNFRTAVNFIELALDLNPDNPHYYKNLGNVYEASGRIDDAIKCHSKAIELRPGYAAAYSALGDCYQQIGRLDDAIAAYECALEAQPGMARAHNNLGIALFDAGLVERAVSHYQEVIRLQPNHVEAYVNIGHTAKHQGNLDNAISWYQKAIVIDPNCAEAYVGMAAAWQRLGQLHTAIACYQQAIEIKPGYAEVYNDLGTIYLELGDLSKAMSAFKKCANLKPNDPQAFINMGIVAHKKSCFERAISLHQKALALKPDSPEALYNLGNAFKSSGSLRQAILCYRQTINLRPDHPYAHSLLIRQLQQICAWDQMAGPLDSLARLTQKALEEDGQTVEMPFLAFSLSDDPGHNLRVAASWASAISARVLGASKTTETGYHYPHRVRSNDKDRITVGYLSADFKNHATAHLMQGLFGFHDRRYFNINAYSYGKKDQSVFRHRIEGGCDRFVDIDLSTPREAARTIADDGVDILVELKGYTEGGRLEICAYRPAPIQVAWLGFPGTSGADFLDYIITDKIVTPQEHASFFTERFVYLPYTYQVNNNRQEIANEKCQRRDFHLPPQQFVFCSFNEPYKIEPVMFEIWTRILHNVKHSILWLLAENRVTQDNLKQAAERNGISGERLIFARKLPKDRHLARLQLADLVLDTRVVNGHTTTSDALWAGVPVLTLKGNHFASRVSASLLSAVGLPELITDSLAEYEAQAVRLANNPDQIKSIREKLAENRLTFPLFDTAGFTRNLEKAYREMWRIYLQGKDPRQIEVLSG